MYGYYAIGTYWKGVYRFAQLITIIQIVQFILGVYALIVTRDCAGDMRITVSGLFIYVSYLVLFLQYYFGRYNKKSD